MILLWFILGIVLIFGIARYNESNKLFWTLLFAFVMGFAGTKMVLDVCHGNEHQSNICFTQGNSTQVSAVTLSALSYYITSVTTNMDKVVTAQRPVSQSTTVLNESNVILSEVFGRTRDQPQLVLMKPPELCLQKNFSTLHDTG